MNTNVANIKWEPITPDGEALIRNVVERQYNRIAAKYGAQPLPLKESVTGTKPAPRYKLLSTEAVARSKPIGWRIKGVLPDTGLAALYGPSGSGKSFLAIDLSMSISEGLDWFGRKTKGCPVVYVCLEGDSGLSNRVAAYRINHGATGEVMFVTQSVDLQNQTDAPDLAKAINQGYSGNGIVVIDTLNRAAPGMDENSSADMGRILAMVKALQIAIGGLVLLVHHTGKDSTKGMRGHSSLFAALDAAIEVSRSGDFREWRVAKSKDGEDGAAHPFKLEVVDLGLDSDGDPITSCVIKPAGPQRAIQTTKPLTAQQKQGMDSFMAAAALGIGEDDKRVRAHIDVWRNEFNRVSTDDTVESKRKAFQRVRSQLVEIGKLVVNEDLYSLPIGFAS